MFNKIRYWFQSKQYKLSAWIRRPRNIETAIEQVVAGMEQFGIHVADASVYPKSEKNEVVGAVVIIAGYIPEKALIFTVSFNYGTFDDYKFTIDGQVSKGNWSKVGQWERWFPAVTRNPVGSESYGGRDCQFSINTYTSYGSMSSATSAQKVAYGMEFFRNFLDQYSVLMASHFTSSIHVWFVPEYSDEFKALEEKNGRYNSANYVGFNSHVIAKFPKGFFCSEQRT